jgi:hypothetical protein
MTRRELRCLGGRAKGCFGAVERFQFPRGKGVADIRGPLRRSRLRPGATIEVRVLLPGAIGKVVRLKLRRSAPPTRTVRCLAPGRQVPHGCGR